MRRSTSKAYLFSRLWVWRQRGPWCISFFTFLILLLKGSGRWKFLTMGTPKQKQEVFPRVSFLSLVLSLGFALFRFCSAFSIKKVWSLPIIWKTIRTSKLTLVIAFALLLFPVLWRQRNWLWEVFKVLSIKFKLSTQHSSTLRKSLPKCHSGAHCGLLFYYDKWNFKLLL